MNSHPVLLNKVGVLKGEKAFPFPGPGFEANWGLVLGALFADDFAVCLGCLMTLVFPLLLFALPFYCPYRMGVVVKVVNWVSSCRPPARAGKSAKAL